MRKTIADYKKEIEDLRAQQACTEREYSKVYEENKCLKNDIEFNERRRRELEIRVAHFEAFVEGIEFALGRKAKGPVILGSRDMPLCSSRFGR